ncbi:MAG: thiamine-monophosphate kinase [Candidatus Cryptobacteroides sp.]
MENRNFSDIGRAGAVETLLRAGGFTASAAFSASQGSIVRTASRIWLEGIDFDLTYFPLKHLGYKCIIGTVGELYAALARPESASVRIGVSAKLDFPQIEELWSGMTAALKEHGIEKVDLDLCPSRNGLTVSISIVGMTDGDVEADRKPARSKDLVCISGSVGAAYLGMALLESEKKKIAASGNLQGNMDISRYKMIVGDYLKPEISPNVVKQLKDSNIVPSFGCLVSRGLADAAKRIASATGLGVKIYSDKIPFEGNSFELGKQLNLDPMSAAMNGGDDFRLLFVIPMDRYETFRHDFQAFSIIGHLARKDVGTVVVMPEGAEIPLHAQGWKEE